MRATRISVVVAALSASVVSSLGCAAPRDAANEELPDASFDAPSPSKTSPRTTKTVVLPAEAIEQTLVIARRSERIARVLDAAEPFVDRDGALSSVGARDGQGAAIAVRVDGDSRGAFRFGSGEQVVTLTLDGASSAPSLAGGHVFFRDALPGVDQLLVATRFRVEQLLVLHDRTRSTFRMHVARAPGLAAPKVVDGDVVFATRNGTDVLRLLAPHAVDARGTVREATMSLDGDDLVVKLDLDGLELPVVLDPPGEVVAWSKKTPASAPPARYDAPAAFDATANAVLVFGGYDTAPRGDLWSWNGTAWTPLCTGTCATTAPAARYLHSAAWGSSGKLLVFGGIGSSGAVADTWSWNGSAWTNPCSSACGASARRGAAMAWDSSRDEYVLFGGYASTGPVDETYVWSGSAWVAKCTGTCVRPPPRTEAAIAFDSKRKKVVLFGGKDLTGARSDSWEWDGATATWTQVCTACATDGSDRPNARASASMAYDANRGVSILYGGYSGTTYYDDTWEWNGSAWSKTTSGSPSQRFGVGLAFDSTRKRTVLFGGSTPGSASSPWSETWEYHAYGASCTSAATCDTPVCEDGRCCEVSCAPCQRCDVTPGLCTTAPDGEDNPGCFGTQYCKAGACLSKKSNGVACANAYECTSGNCVDGVCCNDACTGSCRSCLASDTGGANGTCGNVTAGAKRSTGTACGATAASTCGADGTCDGAGACRKWVSGTVCVAASCASPTSQKNASTCDGAGACVAGATVTCGPGLACIGTACKSTCAGDGDCASGFFCDAGSCKAKKTNGTACGAAHECSSGFCPAQDGVCCDSACTGTCMACSAAKKGSGADGVCGAVPDGADPDAECPNPPPFSCGFDGMCNGAGACRTFAKSGVACADSTSCTAGEQKGKACDGAGNCVDGAVTKCDPYKCDGGGKVCLAKCSVDGDCTDTTFFCDALGLCTKKKTNGASCGEAKECASGSCADGVCCDVACNGQCEACAESASKGTCVAITGDPRGTRTACAGDKALGCAGKCDGTNRAACFFDVGKECGTTCSAGSQTVSQCDGTGACKAGAVTTCDPYVCAADRCKTSCASGSDCAAGYDCSSGACTPSGAKCSGDGLAVINSDGTPQTCGAYRCSGGACVKSCNQTDVDCAPGYTCDTSTHACVPSGQAPVNPAADGQSNDNCGCRVVGAARSGESRWMLAALAAVLIRRRKRAITNRPSP